VGYDLQRAALVVLSLSALLLAASLMPATGLGSYPTYSGPGSGDTGTAPVVDTPVETPGESTPAESTPAESTPVETTSEETDRTTAEEDEPESDDGGEDDEDDSGLAGVLGLILLGPFLALAFVGTYAGTVLTLGSVFGYDSVEWMPFSGRVRSIPQLTMSSLIGTASVTSRFVGQLGAVLGEVATGLAALSRLPAAFGRVLAIAVTGPIRALAGVSLGIGSLFGALSNISLGLGRRGSRDTGSETTTDAREAGGAQPETGDEEPTPLPTSVVEAYDRMTTRLRLPNEHAKTPARPGGHNRRPATRNRRRYRPQSSKPTTG